MVQGGSVSWNKIIAVGASFGIPLVSILAWLLVYGTKLVDKVDNIQSAQVLQGSDIKEIKNFMYSLSKRVDTVYQAQIDSKKDFQHQIELRDAKYSSSLFIERYVNGKLTFVPVK